VDDLKRIASRTTTITFDCYGTLIDWSAGLNASLKRLFGPMDSSVDLARRYVETEAEVEGEGYRRYRDVMQETALRTARRLGRPLAPMDAARFAAELPSWKPFADTNEGLALLKKRYRLGVLSNIDRDLFAGTSTQFSITFDFVITAEDVKSYKPAHGHFERLLASAVKREEVLHVAQSLYHDGRACRDLGIAFVWINRYNDGRTDEADVLGEFPDLISFARRVSDDSKVP
jgi:2-haloalkanoic acid dehalogenase type II